MSNEPVVDFSDDVPESVRREALEQLAESGHVVPVPQRWLVHDRPKHGGREHGFIALRPMRISGRRVRAGDILAEHEGTPALEAMLLRHEVAELPLDYGVLALVIALRARVELLEAATTVLG